jgi:hypothetical protein
MMLRQHSSRHTVHKQCVRACVAAAKQSQLVVHAPETWALVQLLCACAAVSGWQLLPVCVASSPSTAATHTKLNHLWVGPAADGHILDASTADDIILLRSAVAAVLEVCCFNLKILKGLLGGQVAGGLGTCISNTALQETPWSPAGEAMNCVRVEAAPARCCMQHNSRIGSTIVLRQYSWWFSNTLAGAGCLGTHMVQHSSAPPGGGCDADI